MPFRILFVDRNSSGMEAYSARAVWKDAGFVLAAHTADPDDALDAAVRRTFDALICMNRPSAKFASGLLLRLSHKQISIPVIVISQTDDSKAMRECFLLGAVDVLTEPVTERDLAVTLSRAAQILNADVIKSEYRTALDAAVAALPHTAANAALLDKLYEFLLHAQGTTATLESTADFFGFNRDYFGRFFKSKVGITFGTFYKSFMMEYAALLLSSGRFRVQDVSNMLGFSSADYFTRVFRQCTGKTPSELKRGV